MTQTTSITYQKFRDEKDGGKEKERTQYVDDTAPTAGMGGAESGATPYPVTENSMADEVPSHLHERVAIPDTVQIVVRESEATSKAQDVPIANGHATEDMSAVTVVIDEKWSWITLITSVVSIFCCSICGVFATVVAILAYIDHKLKDYERSQRKRNVAMILAVIGIVLGILGLIALLIMLVIRGG